MGKNRIITVQDIPVESTCRLQPVTVSSDSMDDYICIIEMARATTDNSRAASPLLETLTKR